ncbi:MAG: SH3 domain-containing protein [Algiphilus sp.]|nr:SH3 domain-containing protein [Algiphilus sp.]
MTASVGERAARPDPAEALYRVTADWTATYPDPICLQRGDAFSLSGETFDWDGHTWIWARSGDGREGWIPDDLARRSEGVLRAQEAFSAMELSCRAGEQLHGLKQRHGWVWCRHPDGRTGWVPHGRLEKVPPPAT